MDSFFFLGLFCSLLYEYWSAEFQGSDDEDDEEESSSQPLSSSQTDTSKPASSPLPDSSKIGTFLCLEFYFLFHCKVDSVMHVPKF